MEWKIGEIKQVNGEWYQCVEHNDCEGCAFYRCCSYKDKFGNCSSRGRNDKKSVIFKKLEKVGEPYELDGRLFQLYRTFEVPIFTENYASVRELGNNSKISIEIKQNKEDMEENKLNLKPFNIQKAREGKPICTRDGRKARIICFDRRANTPIVALIECDNHAEILQCVHNDGRCVHYGTSDNDLMMLPEKKEGWVNVYNSLGVVTFSHNPYDTKEEALEELKSASGRAYCVDTIKINWEE